jgi:hypothetical protein
VAELYDHQRDPKEFVNRVKDPAMGATLREMRRLLAEGWRSALPA